MPANSRRIETADGPCSKWRSLLGLTTFPFRGRRKLMQNQNWRFLNRVIVVATVTLLVVSFSTFALAQDVRSMVAGTQGGAMSVQPLAMEVNLDAIPQATASEMTPHIKMLRPRDGRTDAEYAEMMRQAARLAGGGNGGNGVLRDAGPAPLSTPPTSLRPVPSSLRARFAAPPRTWRLPSDRPT